MIFEYVTQSKSTIITSPEPLPPKHFDHFGTFIVVSSPQAQRSLRTARISPRVHCPHGSLARVGSSERRLRETKTKRVVACCT